MNHERGSRIRLYFRLILVTGVWTAGCGGTGGYEYDPGTEVYPPASDGAGYSASTHGVNRQPTGKSSTSPAEQAEDDLTLGNALRFYALPQEDAVVLLASTRILGRLPSDLNGPDSVQLGTWRSEAIEFDETLVTLSDWARDGENGEPQSIATAYQRPESVSLPDEIALAYQTWGYGVKHADPLAMVAAIRIFSRTLPNDDAPTRLQLLEGLNDVVAIAKTLPGREMLEELAERESYRLDRLAERIGDVRFGQDWPGFLGPTGDGKSIERDRITDDESPPEWTRLAKAGPRIVWEREVGDGFASCVVVGRRLFLFDRVDDHLRLSCLDAVTGRDYRDPQTGEKTWSHPFSYHSGSVAPGGYAGPRATPLVDEDQIYVVDEAGGLSCVDLETGRQKWHVDAQRELGVVGTQFGVAASPIIEGDLLIVAIGGKDPDDEEADPDEMDEADGHGTAIVALNKSNGQIEYKVGDDIAGYASPIVRTIAGVRTGLAFLQNNLFAFQPDTGTASFQFSWHGQDPMSVNASTPIVVGDEIFLSTAHGKGSALIRCDQTGCETVWADQDGATPEQGMECAFSTPIHHDGYIYGCSGTESDDAELRCIRWDTGEVMWPTTEEQRQLVRFNRASLLFVDGYFLCLTEYGKLYVVKADPEKPDVTEIPLRHETGDNLPPGFKPRPLLKYPCWTAPVLSHGLLYLRDQDRLICVELIPRPVASR